MLRSLIAQRCAELVGALSLVAATAQAADEEEDRHYEGFSPTTVVYLEQANLSIGILGNANEKNVCDNQMAVMRKENDDFFKK